MKIELKHYAPYLGCDAKDSTGKVGVMVGLSLSNDTVKMYYPAHNDKESWFPFENCKLILRPLSDLTKEIEHNGEKFVPIIELCLMREIMSKSTNRNIFTVGIEHGDKYVAHFHNHVFFLDAEFMSFHSDTNQSCDHQYEMFEKLFEWHFNVFDLPKHLWINKNSLTQD